MSIAQATVGGEPTVTAGELRSVAARVGSASRVPSSREDLVDLVAAAQVLVNTAVALQDSAIAALAAVEGEWAEDGTVVEVVRAPGHVAVDAADLLAPALGASHGQAQKRVLAAVRLAAARVPVEDTGPCHGRVPEESGLGGLHAAMRDGRLDGFRAGVVAEELEHVPADVAETVVAALDGYLAVEAAAGLRRRCRRLLGRISPDLVRERAETARRNTGLRRWVSEPGVDTWQGTFPSEDAAAAWAVIDHLARTLVADGTCPTLERARAKALTDLVTGNSTGTYVVTLTVPAGTETTERTATETTATGTTGTDETQPGPTEPADTGAGPAVADPTLTEGPGRAEDLVEVRGIRPCEATLVPRGWVEALLRRVPAGTRECHPRTGALLDHTSTDAYRPGPKLVALVKARDRRCRFPGCTVATTFCDLDHLRPWPGGPTSGENLVCLCRRHHRVKQRPGWRVRMRPGALVEWTDPLGRVRTTAPADALHGLVLPATDRNPERRDASTPGDRLEPAFSGLEFALEHLLAGARAPTAPNSSAIGAARDRHTQRTGRTDWPDEPPF